MQDLENKGSKLLVGASALAYTFGMGAYLSLIIQR